MQKLEIKDQLVRRLKRNRWLKENRRFLWIGGIATSICGMAIFAHFSLMVPAWIFTMTMIGAMVTAIGDHLFFDNRFDKRERRIKACLAEMGYSVGEQFNEKGELETLVDSNVTAWPDYLVDIVEEKQDIVESGFDDELLNSRLDAAIEELEQEVLEEETNNDEYLI